MNCNFHPETEAIVVCVECKKPLCKDCLNKIEGRNYCNECAKSLVSDKSDLNSEKRNLSNMPDDIIKVAGKMDKFLRKKGGEYKNKTGKGLDDYKNKAGKGIDKRFINLKEVGTEMVSQFSTSLKDGNTRDLIKTTKLDTKNPLDEIKKAKELLEIGAITEEEFNEIKKKYLETM